MIGATGLLALFWAMYRRVIPDKRRNYCSMFISTVLAVFLTGVSDFWNYVHVLRPSAAWYTQCCRDALQGGWPSSTSGFIPLATWNS